MPSTTILSTASARGHLAHAIRGHRPDISERRQDLTAATIRAAILRETGKGYPINQAHAAALATLLRQVAQ